MIHLVNLRSCIPVIFVRVNSLPIYKENKMPKIKTNRSAAKRFYKVTATGKVKRARGGKSHSNEKKGKKRMRRLRSGDYVEGAEARRIRKVVPYL